VLDGIDVEVGIVVGVAVGALVAVGVEEGFAGELVPVGVEVDV
jgi:hypothetical protein